MRVVRALTGSLVVSAESLWLPGPLHTAVGLSTYFLFGSQACAAGLLLATLASFVVYLPVTALVLNGGQPLVVDAPAPVLTTRVRVLLLGLWNLTAWAGAGLAAAAG